MTPVTQQQVLDRITGFGVPLGNVFLVGAGNAEVVAIWYPEVGLRSLLIENDELASAVTNYLRSVGVRCFETWAELQEARSKEKWQGWDTCEDQRRIHLYLEEVA